MDSQRNVIRNIIKEVVGKLLEDYAIAESVNELEEKLKDEIFDDFIHREERGYGRVPWNLIPFALLERTWNKFAELGYVPEQFYKNLERIEEIMTENAIKLKVLTELSGHSSYGPDYDFESHGLVGKNQKNGHIVEIKLVADPQQLRLLKGAFTKFEIYVKDEEGEVVDKKSAKNNADLKRVLESLLKTYKIDDIESSGGFFDNYKRKFISKPTAGYIEDFYDWSVDEKGIGIMSDYGLQPLLKLLIELKMDETPEEKLVTIDKMLNVVHQRSDIASWFVEGGSRALSKLAGMEEFISKSA